MAHNPKVAGSNPAPLLRINTGQRAFPVLGDALDRLENGFHVIDLSSPGSGMASPTDELERRRLDRLVEQLTRQLGIHRSLTLDVNYVEDVDLWRKAARLAGRRLGIPVRTGVSRDGTRVSASEGPSSLTLPPT